jgi:hypothetical protein
VSENINRVASLSPPPERELVPASAPAPDPVEREPLMAQISAEIYAHLARGILPLRADSVAAIRPEAIDQRREFLAELERLK